jgi:hypothetical protein
MIVTALLGIVNYDPLYLKTVVCMVLDSVI